MLDPKTLTPEYRRMLPKERNYTALKVLAALILVGIAGRIEYNDRVGLSEMRTDINQLSNYTDPTVNAPVDESIFTQANAERVRLQ